MTRTGSTTDRMPGAALVALLPSPFLGPAVWRPVADILLGGGWPVVVPDAAAGPAGPARTPEDVLANLLAGLPPERDLVLVPHSNAGLYVPAIAQQRQVRAYGFVDALLPPREGGEIVIAPAGLVDSLRPKADEAGLLPHWTDWWDEADIAGLFPPGGLRGRVEREQRRLPLSYLEARLRVPTGWDARPGAYLAFGATYERERLDAERRGWPVAELPGRHLHMLVEPDQVAGRIRGLLAAAGAMGIA